MKIPIGRLPAMRAQRPAPLRAPATHNELARKGPGAEIFISDGIRSRKVRPRAESGVTEGIREVSRREGRQVTIIRKERALSAPLGARLLAADSRRPPEAVR